MQFVRNGRPINLAHGISREEEAPKERGQSADNQDAGADRSDSELSKTDDNEQIKTASESRKRLAFGQYLVKSVGTFSKGIVSRLVPLTISLAQKGERGPGLLAVPVSSSGCARQGAIAVDVAVVIGDSHGTGVRGASRPMSSSSGAAEEGGPVTVTTVVVVLAQGEVNGRHPAMRTPDDDDDDGDTGYDGGQFTPAPAPRTRVFPVACTPHDDSDLAAAAPNRACPDDDGSDRDEKDNGAADPARFW
ncbi:hypothetical protein EDB84DRAFT_1678968 [Lactarius hengduanensis]|nr:hypothetical protein EDB84DRAFT_1678968 [Lactarius hengduanensis]